MLQIAPCGIFAKDLEGSKMIVSPIRIQISHYVKVSAFRVLTYAFKPWTWLGYTPDSASKTVIVLGTSTLWSTNGMELKQFENTQWANDMKVASINISLSKICITTLRESNNLSLPTVSSHAFYLESFSPFRPKISAKFKLLPRFPENKSPPVVHNTIWYLHACVQYSGAHWGLSVFFVCCFQGLIALYDSVKNVRSQNR